MSKQTIEASLRQKHEDSKALAEENILLRSLLEQSREVIYRLNLQTGRYEYISRSVEDVVGYSAAELMAVDMEAASLMIHPEDRAVREAATASLETAGKAEAEYRQRTKSGEWRWLSNYMSLTRDGSGRPLYRNGSIRDITARKEAEESAERLTALMSHNPSLVFLKNESGTYVYLNDAYENTFVHTKEWYGKTDYHFWPKESADLFLANDAEVLKSGQPKRFLEDSKDLTGQRHCWLCYKFPFTDSRGRRYLGGIGIEVTDQVQAEEALAQSEQLLSAIIDSIPVMLCIWDGRLKKFRFNKHFRQVLGWTEADTEDGQFMSKTYPDPEYRGCVAQFMRSLDGGWRDLKTTAKDGTPIDCAWANIKLRDESSIGIGIDIQDRKRAEDLLREADRKKDEFLAMLAHELRNPMAAISSATTLLSMPNISQERMDYAKDVLKHRVKQLARLVDDMLDVSRIIRGKTELHKQDVDLSQAIHGAVEATKTFFEERRQVLDVHVSAPLPIYGDLVRLEQVLNNLLSNAARYTSDGGRISLAAESDGDRAVVRVRDNGIGMHADLLPRIFELFGQGDDSLHRSSGGLGIGLTIVKKLVELHGGAVSAFSEGQGKGSEFVITLPLRKITAPSIQNDERQTASPGLSILVCEDNRDTADLTAELLILDGHTVDLAYDGPSALQRGLEKDYDAILLDIGLPGLNGFEVASRLRNGNKRKTKIIAVSGYGQDRDLDLAKAAGIDYHLLKPVDLEKLAAILATL